MRLGVLAEDPERPPFWATQRCLESGLSSQECHELWKFFIESERESASAQYRRNVDLLFQHYEIDRMAPDAWQQLALELAARHVPAFQVEHALLAASKRRAKKPTKLDVRGTLCLYPSWPLHELRKKGPLCNILDALATKLNEEVKSTGLKDRTIRNLRQQMREAHSAYRRGDASDFQCQFVEKVFPRLIGDFEHLALTEWRATPSFVAFIRHQ
jgi:hypothetical protein